MDQLQKYMVYYIYDSEKLINLLPKTINKSKHKLMQTLLELKIYMLMLQILLVLSLYKNNISEQKIKLLDQRKIKQLQNTAMSQFVFKKYLISNTS